MNNNVDIIGYIKNNLKKLGEKDIAKLKAAATDVARTEYSDDIASDLSYLAGYSVLVCEMLIKSKKWEESMSRVREGSLEHHLVLILLLCLLLTKKNQHEIEEVIFVEFQKARFQKLRFENLRIFKAFVPKKSRLEGMTRSTTPVSTN